MRKPVLGVVGSADAFLASLRDSSLRFPSRTRSDLGLHKKKQVFEMPI